MDQRLAAVIDRLIEVSQGKKISEPSPTDSLIESYQNDLGISFSDEYKLFLKFASTVFYGTKDPLVITPDKSSRSELCHAITEGRSLGLPDDWLPICEDNGDYYCIVPSGAVRYWTSNGSSDEYWTSLAEWIEDVWIGGN